MHSYADDTQLNLSFKPGSDMNETIAKYVIENCSLSCSARLALHGEKAHCSVACGSIHASTFPLPGLQMGPIVKLVIFMQIRPFHFLQHTKANHHKYKSQGKPSLIVFS